VPARLFVKELRCEHGAAALSFALSTEKKASKKVAKKKATKKK